MKIVVLSIVIILQCHIKFLDNVKVQIMFLKKLSIYKLNFANLAVQFDLDF